MGSLEWGLIDERSESHGRAKRGSLPQGLDSNPAVGRMIKLVKSNNINIQYGCYQPDNSVSELLHIYAHLG